MDGDPREHECPNCARLEREVAELKARIEQLEVLLEQSRRGRKRAIRPAVVNRKVWGGNRTDTGARAQSILMSAIRWPSRRS